MEIAAQLGVSRDYIRKLIGPGLRKSQEQKVGKKEEALSLRDEGLSNLQIAESLDVNRKTISNWIGSGIRSGQAEFEARKKEAYKLRQQGFTNNQIAEQMGVPYRTVHSYIGAMPHSYRVRTVPQAVYDEAVRLRREDHLDNKSIAEQVGVNPNTIWRWMGADPNKEDRQQNYQHLNLHSRAMYLRECGYTITEIADEMKIPRSTVGDWVKGYGCYGQPTDL